MCLYISNIICCSRKKYSTVIRCLVSFLNVVTTERLNTNKGQERSMCADSGRYISLREEYSEYNYYRGIEFAVLYKGVTCVSSTDKLSDKRLRSSRLRGCFLVHQ